MYPDKMIIPEDACTPASTKATIRQPPNGLSTDEWMRRCGTCIEWSTTQA